jgi:adenine/guanine/hypoxanthine permease
MNELKKTLQDKKILLQETIGGITTFVAAMYIIIINPAILKDAGLPYNAAMTATILVSAFSSIAMGLYAKNPILIAPGMGLNAYFTYAVVIGLGIKPEVALGAVFWSGVIFILLSVFNIRTHILKAIPHPIRLATAVGLGIFIALIGLVNTKFIVNKVPLSGMGNIDLPILVFLAGLFITSLLVVKRIKGALILGIIFTSILAWPVGRWLGDTKLIEINGIVSMPDFSLFLALDLIGSLKIAILPVAFAMLFTDMFDSISTFLGVAEACDLKDPNGEPRRIKESLIVDSFATLVSGLFGSSPGTAYIESASGIKAGGRTGLSAVISGLLFLPFLFLSPLAEVIPSVATAPILVIVGALMISPIRKIEWDNMEIAIPAFVTLILIPFTYSITQGVIWGMLFYTFLKIMNGKFREISIMLIIIDLFGIAMLYIDFYSGK